MTATEYAKGVEATPEDFSWRQLEKRGFAGYPTIEALIDAAGQAMDSKKARPVPRGLSCVGFLFYLPVQVAPMFTAGVLETRGDPQIPLAVAGVFALAHIILSGRELVRAARGCEPVGAQLAGLTVANFLFCLLTLWTAYPMTVLEAPSVVWLYFILFLVMTILCFASAATMIWRGIAHHRGKLVFNRNPMSALGAAINDLSTEEKETITNDIANAVDILATAGIISEADKTAALKEKLGGLVGWRWTVDHMAGQRR